MTVMIALDAEDAALVLDMLDALTGPMSPDVAMECIRRAKYLRPELEAAFAEAGVDPLGIDLPEVPLMVPGSEAQ